jgi:hypothetical protein
VNTSNIAVISSGVLWLVLLAAVPPLVLHCCCRAPEPKPPQVTAAICEALQRSFIFRGIPEQLLVEVRI